MDPRLYKGSKENVGESLYDLVLIRQRFLKTKHNIHKLKNKKEKKQNSQWASNVNICSAKNPTKEMKTQATHGEMIR